MLTRLRIENFKAWREADIRFGKITGFFGSNSAGKSSLMQFLLLLKQTKDATDRGIVLDFGGPGDLVNLTTFADVVHRRDTNRNIGWLLDWTLPGEEKLRIEDSLDAVEGLEGNRIQARCVVGFGKRGMVPRKLEYRSAGARFTLRKKEGSGEKEHFELTASGWPGFQFVRNRGRPWPMGRPIKTHLFGGRTRGLHQNADFLGDLELKYEDLMDSIFYLGPLRDYPRREYYWGGSGPDDVGPRGERTVEAVQAATVRNELRNLGGRRKLRPFQEMVAHWLRELGLVERFEVREIAQGTQLYRATVRTGPSSPLATLADVGFGLSQVLPVVVLLYYVPERSIVLLEQPSLHLHPAAQSALADLMLHVAKTRQLQIAFESHSEHLLRRLQRRVAEERATEEEVKLYFVSSEEGEASLSDLRLNRWGEIENWPDGFFGDEMGEIAAIAEASLSRRLGHEP